MDKNLLNEINIRIKSCFELQDKLEYIDSLLRNKKIGELEHNLLKQEILNGKIESVVKKEIEDYVEKAYDFKNKIKADNNIKIAAVLLILIIGIIAFTAPNYTGLSIFRTSGFKLHILSGSPPTVINVTINSTLGTNLTTENLTVYWNATDPDNDPLVNISDWRVNGTSIAILNMPFEADGRQNTTDYSSYSNNGTAFNNVKWNATSGVNVHGAYQFDGVDDIINVTHEGFPSGNKPFSFSLFANAKSLSGQQVAFFYGAESNPNAIYIDINNCGLGSRWGLGSWGVSDTICAANAVNTDEWHHIAVTWNTTVATLYQDGVSQGTATSEVYSFTNKLVQVGAIRDTSFTGTFFQGGIDEVLVFNRTLSSQEIVQLNSTKNNVVVSQELKLGENWSACVTPSDGSQNGSTACSNNITIVAATDTTPPVITNVAASPTNQSATITWSTDELANETIFFGVNLSLTGGNITNASLATSHSVPLANLTNFTLYYYNITSCDSSNNCKTNGSFNFTTLQNTAPNSAPVIISVVINSTYGTNSTKENLTAYSNSTDIDNNPIINITDWRVNGTSIAILNMPFEADANQNTTDYSSYLNNGTAKNGVKWNSTGVNGHGVYQFDGVNDLVNITGAGFPTGNKPFSFSLFANAKSLSGQQVAFFYGEESAPNSIYVDINNCGGGSRWGLGTWGSGDPLCEVNAVNTDEWHHIAVTWNTTDAGLYVDGVLQGGSYYHPADADKYSFINHEVQVGGLMAAGFTGTFFQGGIDEVLVFNRTLSSQEIVQLNSTKNNVVVSQELNVRENWSACVTPNDGIVNGNTLCSNNATIVNASVNISSIYPNNTGVVQNTAGENNISLSRNYSLTTNLTFNATVQSPGYNTLSFQWFVNGVLKFIQTLTNAFTSTFSYLFNTSGPFNITVNINSTNSDVNATFTFKLNTSNGIPIVNSLFINSTYGTNLTIENLTAYWNTTDPNAENIVNITDWRINGTSIAILNMPFEAGTNGTATAANWTKDYSTYGNNGTVLNAIWNATAGAYGSGAYQFDYVSGGNISVNGINPVDNFSVVALFKPVGPTTISTGAIVEKTIGGDVNSQWLLFLESNAIKWRVKNGTSGELVTVATSVATVSGKWYHVVATKNNKGIALYVNGVQIGNNTGAPGVTTGGTGSTLIGMLGAGAPGYNLNGTIDYLQIYNRSLSANEILLLNSSKEYIIASNETKPGENWSACVTPNDGNSNGNTLCSNNVTIVNASIAITSVYPNDTGLVQNLTGETNITIARNYSLTTNLTFNATIQSPAYSVFTFNWFVNGVLKAIQVITGAVNTFITSTFSYLFNTTGNFNITVNVNSTNSEINSSFTFNLTTSNGPPVVNSIFINSTFGTNLTTENLTAYWNTTDPNAENIVANITDWRVNGTSIEILNMPFEADGKQNATDYSTYNNSGIVHNGAILNKTSCYSGSCYYLDGSDDFIDTNNMSSLNIVNNFTVTIWVKPKTNADSNIYIMDKAVEPAGNPFYQYGINHNNNCGDDFEFDTGQGASLGALCNVGGTTADVWYFIVGTYNGTGNKTIYMNGVQTASVAVSGDINSYPTSNLTFGRLQGQGSSNSFNGFIDDARVYNRVLSRQEILALYNNRSDLINSQELKPLQNWSACVTPNDGISDGVTSCSNNIVLANTINIISVYPNQTGLVQNTTGENNISITRNYSLTTNLTFNATVTPGAAETLSFQWFVNGVLKFIQTLTNAFTSTFSYLFNTSGQFNITVSVNGSRSDVNASFTFQLNTSNAIPVVNNIFINSTNGLNTTNENLTVYWNNTDPNAEPIYNITDWRVNGTSIAVLNMPFEADGRQNATDYSTNGNNGTNFGSVFVNGKIGKAYQFSNSFINVTSSSSLQNVQNFTIEFWFNASSTKPSVLFRKLGAGSQTATGIKINLNETTYCTDTDTLLLEVRNGTVTKRVCSSYVVSTGRWILVDALYNGTTVGLYVDGVKQASTQNISGNLFSNNMPVSLGKCQDCFAGPRENPFSGMIDEVKIYNRTLSSKEILLHNSTNYVTIVSDELKFNDMWQAAVTPNDGNSDGLTQLSNNITVISPITITSVYPNDTGQVQNLTTETSLNLSRNYSLTNNLTFNATISAPSYSVFTFNWFVNGVLSFVQVLTNAFTSTFSYLFNTSGFFNVTVNINSTNSDVNATFTFKLNASNGIPVVNSLFINSTNGLNTTIENLTAYWNTTDPNAENIVNITDWRVNGNSITQLNLQFEPNGTNNASDYSSFNHAVTVINTTFNKTGGYDGHGAYLFDGVTTQINVSNVVSSQGDYTFVARINPSSNANNAGGVARFLSKSNDIICDQVKNTFAVRCSYYNGTTVEGTVTSLTNATISNWTHVVYEIINNTGDKLYINGVLENQSNAWNHGPAPSIAYVGSFYIGSTTPLLNVFNGTMDDVRIYNRALSSQEILALYNNRTDLINSQELKPLDNWSACVTPNDGSQDGATSCSNNIVLANNINITSIFPNQTGLVQNTTGENNISITRNYSLTTNLTFNATVTPGAAETLSFQWFVNGVLKFIQTLTNAFTSTFSFLFNTSGQFNVTVSVNGSRSDVNASFTFQLNTSNGIPIVNSIFINSTNGLNTTNENLTAYWNTTDPNGDPIYNITDWRLNGSSLAVLNMPFEANAVNTSLNVSDYSTFGNNGTVFNAGNITFNKTGGFDGHGAYQFNGNNTYLKIPLSNSLNITGDITLMAYINSVNSCGNTQCGIIVARGGGGGVGQLEYDLSIVSGGFIFNYYNGTTFFGASGGTFSLNKWTHIAAVHNTVSNTIVFYVNGVIALNTTAGGKTNFYNNPNIIIGADTLYNSFAYFNGSIDDVRIYNRSLSTQEILSIYNNQSNVINSQELQPGDNWSACVTPNDGITNGNILCSNNITVMSPIAITSVYPNDTGLLQNITTETSLNLSRNYSLTTNLTFNATVQSPSYSTFTFNWFVNGVLSFIQVLTNAFTSTFSYLFNTTGAFNVTVNINSTNSDVNASFTFKLNVLNNPPVANSVFINSTNGLNTTLENLTVYWNSTDADNNNITNITDWRVNGTSISILNMPFEADGRQNATDYSFPTQSNGTIINATWNATGGYNGFGAYQFNGTSDYISIANGNGELQMSNNFSISAFAKMSTTIKQTIIAKGSDGAVNYAIQQQSGGSICFQVRILPGTLKQVCTPAAIPINNWTQVVGVHSDNVSIIYINGVNQNTTNETNGTVYTDTNPVTIGTQNNLAFKFSGAIDDVRIYNRALSQQQILALYNNRTDMIVSQELKPGENWSACVTPNDGITNGATVCSNNVTIISPIVITSVYPNDTGLVQNLTTETILNLSRNYSLSTNLTFNATISAPSYSIFTFNWFVNGVLSFVQVLTNAFTSTFSYLFNTSGFFNITVSINSTNSDVNATFTFRFNTSNGIPVVNNIFINSTTGLNTTIENLTAYWNTTDPNGESIINITDWRVNNVSISILNMPFEANADTSNNATDYSMFGKNATVTNATFNKTGGYDGHGAYKFNATRNANILTPTVSSFYNLNNFTVSLRINPSADSVAPQPSKDIISDGLWITGNACAVVGGWMLNRSTFFFCNSTSADQGATISHNISLTNGIWYNYVVTYDTSNNVSIYLDGILRATMPSQGLIDYSGTDSKITIGCQRGATNCISDTIDDVRLYNRSLSSQEILALYNNRTDMIVSNELRPGQNWSACVTPNDGITNGNTLCSNNITIVNASIGIISVYPNQTGLVQNLTGENNISLSRNYSLTTNLTFNATISSPSYSIFTFNWFVNGVLSFVQVLTNAFTSTFSFLFNTSGQFNITVSVNGSRSDVNASFTFQLNTSNGIPIVNSIFINSTNGLNTTNENLTVYWNNTDPNAEPIYNITDWRVGKQSLAVINMPFEADGKLNGTDYSTASNNLTFLGNITFNNTGGYDGSGAYRLDNNLSYLLVSAPSNPATAVLTNPVLDNFTILTRLYTYNAATGAILVFQISGGTAFYINSAGNQYRWVNGNLAAAGNGAFGNMNNNDWIGKWRDLVLVRTQVGGGTGTNITIYLDGVLNITTPGSNGTATLTNVQFGQLFPGRWFNGSVDYFVLYNRSLSAQEIMAIHNNRTDMIVSNELRPGQNWSACVTPNDGITNGNILCSNNITLANNINITSIFPNQTGLVQNTTGENNISITRNYSLTTNLTFNATVTPGTAETLSFQWFVNGVLKFIQTLTNAFTSTFSYLFNTSGQFNITVSVNGSRSDVNASFTFQLNTSNAIPVVNNIFINSTNGLNTTVENLTVYWNNTDPNAEPIYNITDWRDNNNSIEFLNMPFEAGGNTSLNVTDYSTYGNNGTVKGTTWNATGGFDGHGAYIFDGVSSNITVAKSNLTSYPNYANNLSWGAWFNPINVVSTVGFPPTIISQSQSDFYVTNPWFRLSLGTGVITQNRTASCAVATQNATGAGQYSTSATSGQNNITLNTWNFAFCVLNNRNLTLYINGVWKANSLLPADQPFLIANASGDGKAQVFDGVFIGKAKSAGSGFFNGTIDDVQVFNRSLSSQQILALYNNRTDLIVNQELKPGENWSACVTPNDGNSNGNTLCSNNATIINASIGITSVYPNDTGLVQNLTGETNFSINRNHSLTTNLTFNTTIQSPSYTTFSFNWFVNGVLKFIQVITGAVNTFVTSTFSYLFNTTGTFNVSVTVNSTNADVNASFTFNLNSSNTPPTAPNLTFPNNGNDTLTTINVTFQWNASTDAENDSLSYDINLTSQLCANRYFRTINSTNYTSPELSVTTTCGYYNWTVRAFDGTDYSNYSGIFNFTIQPLVMINLTNNVTDFGNMQIFESNDTVDNNPRPFIIDSLSNVLINLKINATTPLWNMSGLGNTTFTFKANTTINFTNAFNYSGSQNTFFPVNGSTQFGIRNLNYQYKNNSAAIDFNVTVPAEENPGQKSSTVVVEGSQS